MAKKLTTLFLLISLVFCSAAGNVSAIDSIDSVDSVEYEDFLAMEASVPIEIRESMEKQAGALESYQLMMESFPKNEYGLPIYPEEYAGAYIEDGHLIVQLTDVSDMMINKYSALCGYGESVCFQQAEYSLNELNSLERYALDMIEDGYNVVSFGICQKENVYQIDLKTDSTLPSAMYDIAADDSNKLPIRFTYQSGYDEAFVKIQGGCGILNEDNIRVMTAGICGTYNGKNAILTCGHGNTMLTTGRYPYISYDGTRIGQVSFARANTDPSKAESVDAYGDFAIVTLNDDVETTTDLFNYVTISGTYSYVPEGATIYKYGNETGLSYGEVIQTSVSDVYGKEYYYTWGLLKSLMHTLAGHADAVRGGDSGGPVYTKNGSEYHICGIVTGGRSGQLDGYGEMVMISTPIYAADLVGFDVKTK